MHSLSALILTAAVTSPLTPTQVIPGAQGSAPKFEAGVLSAPLGPELAKEALQWALANRVHYGLPAGSTLQVVEVFPTRFGASVHLKQTVKDLDVFEAKLVVTVDAQRRVTQVASSLVDFAQVKDGKAMSRDEAMKLAARDIPLVGIRPDGVPFGGAKAFYFPAEGELHRGYVANVQTLDLRRNWYVAIDAVTSETIFRQDRVHHAALDAHVYPISPGGLDSGVGLTPTVLAQLVHADGGSMISDMCEDLTDAGSLVLEDGGVNRSPNTGNHLCGTQLTMYNCCPTKNCDPDAGAVRSQGTVDLATLGIPLSGTVNYDVAVCDRLRRASNLTNPSGDFVYSPVDPPANQTDVEVADPANSDEFAEVHSFFHVNRVYDWVRALSGGSFKMRDEKLNPPVKPVVWSNAMFPNFNELQSDFTCLPPPIGDGHTCVANTLTRIDNAAFMPREQFQQIPIAGFDTGADTLLIFQGNSADAAYDATVIQHEFGHGVVYATAGLSFGNVASDAWGANNEGGALHEGFADYVAASFNNNPDVGPYFGPRAVAGSGAPGIARDGYLRRLTNHDSCPNVLWGEVHQDSMHVSQALWDGRSGPFAGTDNGHTFDAAFYAMLVSITPNADFAMMASAMAARVGEAFPSITDAPAQMTAFFSARGVIGCTKAIDVGSANLPREYFGIAQTGASSQVPGPLQFRVPGAAGVSAVHFTAQSQGGGFGQQGPAIHVRTKVGAPIVVTRSGVANFTMDATKDLTATGNTTLTATVNVDAPCGSDVYVAVSAPGGGATLSALNVTFDPQPTCGSPDAGTDAGVPDAGTDDTTKEIPSVGADSTIDRTAFKGCGCSSPVDFAWPLLGVFALVRRRRAK